MSASPYLGMEVARPILSSMASEKPAIAIDFVMFRAQKSQTRYLDNILKPFLDDQTPGSISP